MSWLIKFAASKFAPWIFLGVAIALAFAFAWTYGAGKTNGVNQERAAQSTAIAAAVAKTKRETEEDLKRRGWQDAKEAEEAKAANAALHDELAELAALPAKTLIKYVTVPNEQGCNCAVSSLGHDFWVRYRSAGGQRLEADPAAADAVRSRM